MTLNSLSRVLRDQGRYAEAADALEAALHMARPGTRQRASIGWDI